MTALTRGTNLPQMSGYNQSALLDVIRRGGEQRTRADLARVTGLSPQTVTNAVRRLIEQGMVSETSVQRRPGAGRPGTSLAIVPESRYAVGVHVDPAAVVVVLVDLAGDIVTTRIVPVPGSETPDAVLDVVAGEIDAIVDGASVGRERLVGVGVVTPGPIDRARGLVLDPPHLTMWHDVPLRDEVARRTGLRTVLDKDVLAVAAATLWYPSAGRPADAAVVYAGTGIAVGQISGGEVVRGASGNAGEAGHLSVGRPFGRCACGRSGCLGGVLSTAAIVENAADRGIVLGSAAARAHEAGPNVQADAGIDELAARAQGGEDAVVDLLEDMGDALGTALTMVCELMDLDTVVLSGPVWERLSTWLGPAVQRAVDAHPMPGRHGVRLTAAHGGVHAAAVGGGCLALDDAFSPRATELLLRP